MVEESGSQTGGRGWKEEVEWWQMVEIGHRLLAAGDRRWQIAVDGADVT